MGSLQLLLDSRVIWEADVVELGNEWKEYSVDLSEHLNPSRKEGDLAFRVLVKESLPSPPFPWRAGWDLL